MSTFATRLRSALQPIVADMQAEREVQDSEIAQRHAAERIALDASHGAEFDNLNATRAAEDAVVAEISNGLARFPA